MPISNGWHIGAFYPPYHYTTTKENTMRLYNVIVIHRKTGNKVTMTSSPVTHAEACVMLSKLTKYPWRIETVEEA